MTVAYLKVQSLHPSYIKLCSEYIFVLRSLPPYHVVHWDRYELLYCAVSILRFYLYFEILGMPGGLCCSLGRVLTYRFSVTQRYSLAYEVRMRT